MRFWYKQYRPQTIKDYIFPNDGLEKAMTEIFAGDGSNVQDMILSGTRGTGKTTFVGLVKSTFEIEDSDYHRINGSDNNSVDDIRKIAKFVNTFANSKFKMVFIDEADRLSPPAQDALKAIMEDSEETRFFLATNSPNKISKELYSRCIHLEFAALPEDKMVARGLKILKAEGVSVKGPQLDYFGQIFDRTYPDMRRFINLLQYHTVDGELQDPSESSTKIDELGIEFVSLLDNFNMKDAKQLAFSTSQGDIENVYKFLYTYLDQLERFSAVEKWKKGIVIIAEYLYRDSTVTDRNLNLLACLIRLVEI